MNVWRMLRPIFHLNKRTKYIVAPSVTALLQDNLTLEMLVYGEQARLLASWQGFAEQFVHKIRQLLYCRTHCAMPMAQSAERTRWIWKRRGLFGAAA